MKNKQLAREILDQIGGKGNIDTVKYCATRVRFALKKPKNVNEVALKKQME